MSFSESHSIRERISSVESFSARQVTRSFFAAASLSSKSVKGSQGSVLVVHRSTLQLGAMVANVDAHEIEWRGRDLVACVVQAVKASYLCITAHTTSTAGVRCPENVSELCQISGLLVKQKREFIITVDWNMQLETTGFLLLVGGLRGRGDRRVRHVRKRSQHRLPGGQLKFLDRVSRTCGLTRGLRGRRMRQLPSMWCASPQKSRLDSRHPKCRRKWIARHWAAAHAMPNNSPQEMAVSVRSAGASAGRLRRVVASVLQIAGGIRTQPQIRM